MFYCFVLSHSLAYDKHVNDKVNSEGRQQSQPAGNKAYISETSLRVLARMIARDLLAGKPFLNHMPKDVTPVSKPENSSEDAQDSRHWQKLEEVKSDSDGD